MRYLVLGQSLDALIDHRGKTPTKLGAEFEPSGVPVASAIMVADGRLELSRARYVSVDTWKKWMREPTRRGDVLLTSEAPLGRVARVPTDDPLVLGQRLFGLRGGSGVLDSGFLFYALHDKRVLSDLIARSTGTTVTGIRQSALRNVVLRVPEFPAQQRIARVLGALDDKIAANAELARTADDLAKASFDRALTLPGATNDPLFERFDVTFGEAFKGTMFSQPGEGRPLIRIRDLRHAAPKLWSTESRPNETVVRPGDILVGMDAEFYPVVWLGPDGLLNQRVCKVTGRGGLSNATTRQALAGPVAAIEAEKSGTTVIHLNKSDLTRARVAVPSDEALAAFDQIVGPLHDLRVSLAEEDRRLAALRDTLLPNLMSGRLKVRDAEKTVSDAV